MLERPVALHDLPPPSINRLHVSKLPSHEILHSQCRQNWTLPFAVAEYVNSTFDFSDAVRALAQPIQKGTTFPFTLQPQTSSQASPINNFGKQKTLTKKQFKTKQHAKRPNFRQHQPTPSQGKKSAQKCAKRTTPPPNPPPPIGYSIDLLFGS